MTKNKKLIVTHNGKFHADDVFAVAVMGMVFSNYVLKRTRDENVIARGDIVIDVGGVYNSKKDLFDHHQTGGAGKRSNSIPYSSLGLVWKKYGIKVCGSKKIADYLDKKFIQQIDAIDNGVDILKSKLNTSVYGISEVIDAFVPAWDEEETFDKSFIEVVSVAKKILQREIKKANSKFKAEKFVIDRYKKSKNKKIIILDRYYPWQDLVANIPEVMFVIYKKGSLWYTSAVRKDPTKFANRKSFPQKWGGKMNDNFAKISGVKDGVFCHKGLFLAGSKTKSAAEELAKKALEV